jgi:hypothetical protein
MLIGRQGEAAGCKGMEDRRYWYEAEVLMADLTGHRHIMQGARLEEIEARMRLLYPRALTILVRLEDDERPPRWTPTP